MIDVRRCLDGCLLVLRTIGIRILIVIRIISRLVRPVISYDVLLKRDLLLLVIRVDREEVPDGVVILKDVVVREVDDPDEREKEECEEADDDDAPFHMKNLFVIVKVMD